MQGFENGKTASKLGNQTSRSLTGSIPFMFMISVLIKNYYTGNAPHLCPKMMFHFIYLFILGGCCFFCCFVLMITKQFSGNIQPYYLYPTVSIRTAACFCLLINVTENGKVLFCVYALLCACVCECECVCWGRGCSIV